MKSLEWRKRIDVIHEKHLNKIEKCISEEVLYHYTSPGGLMGIINSASFWMTDSDYLNDMSESFYFYDVYHESTELEGSPESRYINSFPFQASMIPYYHANCHNDERRTLRKEKEVRYILSLSLDEDNINLWNYYTKTAGSVGYCLGFNAKQLSSTLTSEGEIVHGKVIYDRNQQLEILHNLLVDYWELYKELRHTYQRSYLYEKLEHNLVVFSIFMKDECFSYENEYRFAAVQVGDEIVDKREFREVNGAFVPYIKGKFDNSAICRVGISPTHRIDIVRKGTDDLMLSHHLKAEIYNSTIPLRY